jgi:hypothetical protein
VITLPVEIVVVLVALALLVGLLIGLLWREKPAPRPAKAAAPPDLDWLRRNVDWWAVEIAAGRVTCDDAKWMLRDVQTSLGWRP